MDITQASRHFAFLTTTAPGVPVLKLSTESGQPAQRFRKELIRVGHYVKATDGLDFDVTREALDHWVMSFGKMKEAGVSVPVPIGHTQDATANRGWVREMFREGDSLYGVIELIGTDAIALAGRTDVSIFSPPASIDGRGTQYLRPITHVALVTDPVVPGLAGFEAIAASLASVNPKDVTILQRKEPIAMADPILTPPAAPPADAGTDTATQVLNTLKNEIGKAFMEMDDVAFMARVKELLKARTQIKAILGSTEAIAAPEAAAEAMAASLAKLIGDTVKPVAPPVAASLAKTPDPMLVQLAADNRRMKLDVRVAAGKMTPAQRDLLVKQYVGDDGAAIALSLSKGIDDGFETLLKVFDASAGTSVLGEKTGAQILGLSLGNPNNDGGGVNPLVANAEKRAKAAKELAQR